MCINTTDVLVQGVKLSSWLEGKLKQSLSKNMVFPACTDIKLPFLLDEEDLATIAMPLDLPAVPVERTSSPGPLSGAHRASNSSLSSIDLPQDGSNGGDKANKAAQVRSLQSCGKKCECSIYTGIQIAAGIQIVLHFTN